MLNGKTILITGGTGSFGHKFTRMVFDRFKPQKLIIFSRDEFKQYQMAKLFPEEKYPIRFFLGDVRDKNRLMRAFEDVDYVIHAAALKQVPALEYNPMEAVKTNIRGADNIIDAALDRGVKKVIALSTDKAVGPVNLYGATKLVAEKVFVAANAYGGGRTKFSVVRYGNVVGSRGSVIPLFLEMQKNGVKEFPVTHERMTRFWITLEQAVEMVLKGLETSLGAETYVPIIPSMKITDLGKALDPDCTFKIIGVRPGEKIAETLVSEDESRNTREYDGMYVILPPFSTDSAALKFYSKYPAVKEGFAYRSDTNPQVLSVKELKELVKAL